MRQIKFRAWDENTKEMYMPYLGQSLVLKLSEFAEPLGHKVMQFTGLIDKNGVDIYEGDIVKWTRTDEVGSIYWHESGLWAIKWKLTGISAIASVNNYRFYAFDPIQEFEITGNIYENHD